MDELDEILAKLGEPDRIGNSNTWVGNHYSKKDLILDLQKLKQRLTDDLK